jgi:prevent-host-death family protein
MKMSIREIRAQFAAAIAAVEKGERVVITRNGEPVAELGPPPVKAQKFDWDKLDAVRRELGLDKVKLPDGWQEDFDDPAFSREVLGLDDDWEPYRP